MALIINVDFREPIVDFLEKIAESLETKYEYLKNLSGIKINELRKVTGVKDIANTHHSKKNHESNQFLQLKGLVKDSLKANDHVMVCSVDS